MQWRLLGWIAVAALLTLVFLAYLRPGFLVDLANQILLCM
jgi:hypothetical protein